ncbi:MAG: hypothetical protein WCC27_02245, partial [Acidobacteriaceae bacterium]
MPALVRGDEHFGRKLLLETRRANPGRNVVVAPLPLALILASVDVGSTSETIRGEISGAFDWNNYPEGIPVASRMLLGAFEKPSQSASGKGHEEPFESAWIENTILYEA